MKSFKATYLSLLVIYLLCSCSVQQNINSTDSPRFESGKCYAKCMIPQTNKMYYSDYYAIYTGDEEEEDVDIDIIKVVLKPSSNKWVKKKADRNCISPNPDDCLVWCSVIEPEIAQNIKVLKDTTQSSNFDFRQLEYEEENTEENQLIEWREVICEKNITPKIVMQIKSLLDKEGYDVDLASKNLDSETLKELRSYQKANGLPQGNLDYETLDVLGVIIE